MWRIRTPLLVAAAVAGGVLWWWAVLRLALAPARAGVVEGAVAVGGWGLSLLPVHCVPLGRAAGISEARRRRDGPLGRAAARAAGRAARRVAAVANPTARRPVRASWTTRASRRRRSGGGSGRS